MFLLCSLCVRVGLLWVYCGGVVVEAEGTIVSLENGVVESLRGR